MLCVFGIVCLYSFLFTVKIKSKSRFAYICTVWLYLYAIYGNNLYIQAHTDGYLGLFYKTRKL